MLMQLVNQTAARIAPVGWLADDGHHLRIGAWHNDRVSEDIESELFKPRSLADNLLGWSKDEVGLSDGRSAAEDFSRSFAIKGQHPKSNCAGKETLARFPWNKDQGGAEPAEVVPLTQPTEDAAEDEALPGLELEGLAST